MVTPFKVRNLEYGRHILPSNAALVISTLNLFLMLFSYGIHT